MARVLPHTQIWDKFLDAADRKGLELRTAESRLWFYNKARKLSLSPSQVFAESKGKLTTNIGIGGMYFAYYDPKWKKELPYYDTFPLFIPIQMYGDRVLGINLHYLPPTLRAFLLGQLMTVASNRYFDERTKLKLSYAILKGAAKFRAFQPCVKMYLKKHFRSRFVKVDGDEWEIAIALPVEQFEKMDKGKVWADSRRKMKK